MENDRKHPWLKHINWPLGTQKGSALLDLEFSHFSEWIKPTTEEIALRAAVLALMEKIIKFDYPDAIIQLFGSASTGVYLSNSDMDCAICVPTSHDFSVLTAIEGMVLEHNIATSARCIPNARVPICKFTTTPELGAFPFDFSYHQQPDSHGPQGSKLQKETLASLGEERERATRTLLVVKLLFMLHSFDEAKDGGLGGLALFCLVIYFYQQPGWDRGKVYSPIQDLHLLMKYYTEEVDWNTACITILDGGKLLSKQEMGWHDENKPDAICIQHPIHHDDNLTSGVKKHRDIKAMFLLIVRRIATLNDMTYEITDEKVGPGKSLLSMLGIKVSKPYIKQREARHSAWKNWKEPTLKFYGQTKKLTETDGHNDGTKYVVDKLEEIKL